VNRKKLIEQLLKIVLWIVGTTVLLLDLTDVFEPMPDYLETIIIALATSALIIASWFMPSKIAERKLNKGLRLLDKDSDKAVRYLKEYLDFKMLSDIERRNALRILGVAHHKRGDDEEAIHCLTQALEGQDRDNDLKVETLGAIGIIYSEAGEYQKAVEHFDRTFDIIFAMSKAHIDKSIMLQVVNAYIKAGKKEKAVLIYDRLLMIRGFKRDRRVEELLDI